MLGNGELYEPIVQSWSQLVGFIHVVCLGISNKYVAVPDRTGQHSPLQSSRYLSGHCNISVMLKYARLSQSIFHSSYCMLNTCTTVYITYHHISSTQPTPYTHFSQITNAEAINTCNSCISLTFEFCMCTLRKIKPINMSVCAWDCKNFSVLIYLQWFC